MTSTSGCTPSTLCCFLSFLSSTPFPFLTDVLLNCLVEYDCFDLFRLNRLHGNHTLEYSNLESSTSLRNEIQPQQWSFLAFKQGSTVKCAYNSRWILVSKSRMLSHVLEYVLFYSSLEKQIKT